MRLKKIRCLGYGAGSRLKKCQPVLSLQLHLSKYNNSGDFQKFKYSRNLSFYLFWILIRAAEEKVWVWVAASTTNRLKKLNCPKSFPPHLNMFRKFENFGGKNFRFPGFRETAIPLQRWFFSIRSFSVEQRKIGFEIIKTWIIWRLEGISTFSKNTFRCLFFVFVGWKGVLLFCFRMAERYCGMSHCLELSSKTTNSGLFKVALC